jgi:hypothetical protein
VQGATEGGMGPLQAENLSQSNLGDCWGPQGSGGVGSGREELYKTKGGLWTVLGAVDGGMGPL